MTRTGLIAEKLGMSSLFTEQGASLPVTLLKLNNCQVVGHRTLDKDGYTALILGAANVKPTKVSKSVREVFAKKKIETKAHLKEFRITEDNYLEVGLELKAEHFKAGQFVDISGTSIGKGFAGGMKRHNFRGLEATHGVSVSHRSHGSTGGRQDPGRVFKNKKMAGHMGDCAVTKQNLQIVDVNVEENIILVKGSVPGAKGAIVYITDAIKKR
ncbi:MAG UNVERIFIED_CONTAM: 50S ribosomal protein L3 [Rickettsiaceae bacterium]|jgi:large subunit ribosomal protein L3